jgi:hypothetical protein
MSDYIEEIFERADLQAVREFLINGAEGAGGIDRRPYKQRLEEGCAPMGRFLDAQCAGAEERDAAFSCITQACTAYQDIFFETGMKAGARLLYQLLFEHRPFSR